ncbi:hypothetical protein D3C76_1474980 [compost metagenome]
MLGLRKYTIGIPDLHNFTLRHNSDAVKQLASYIHLMSDEHDSDRILLINPA